VGLFHDRRLICFRPGYFLAQGARSTFVFSPARIRRKHCICPYTYLIGLGATSLCGMMLFQYGVDFMPGFLLLMHLKPPNFTKPRKLFKI